MNEIPVGADAAGTEARAAEKADVRSFRSLDEGIDGKSVVRLPETHRDRPYSSYLSNSSNSSNPSDSTDSADPSGPADPADSGLWPYSMADYLKKYRGRMLRIRFMAAGGKPGEQIGILQAVGTDFLGLRLSGSDDMLILNLPSVRSVRIYTENGGKRPG